MQSNKIGKNWARFRLLFQKLWFSCLWNGFSRADYLRKKDILREIGTNVYFYSRIFPSDPKLIRLHNNISIATNVRFITHDRIDIILSGMTGKHYSKKYGCIEVMDNVFIGADTIILPGVRIGPNAVVGAGSVVTRDVPPGQVVAGSPAEKIGDFDRLIRRRKKRVKRQKDPDKLWAQFEKAHRQNTEGDQGSQQYTSTERNNDIRSE